MESERRVFSLQPGGLPEEAFSGEHTGLRGRKELPSSSSTSRKNFNNFSPQEVGTSFATTLTHSERRSEMSLPITANAQAVSRVSPNATPQANSRAKAARDYVASNPDTPAAESPFGKLVMQIAKGNTPST
jgi:hypothetical protein